MIKYKKGDYVIYYNKKRNELYVHKMLTSTTSFSYEYNRKTTLILDNSNGSFFKIKNPKLVKLIL